MSTHIVNNYKHKYDQIITIYHHHCEHSKIKFRITAVCLYAKTAF